MKIVFADTSYWIALIVQSDDLHEVALGIEGSLEGSRIITTDLVIVELLNGLAGRGAFLRDAGISLFRAMTDRGSNAVIRTDEALIHSASELYASRSDKDWSLTDCASMLVCNRFDVQEVLTHDHHFVQTGFVALLRG